MIVSIDPSSQTPVFEQIRAQIAAKIADERLPAGAKLPTIRALAAQLGLAVNTVAHAYRELESAGLIVTRPRHGTTVAAGRSGLAGSASREQLRAAARTYAQTALQLGFSGQEAVRQVSEFLQPDSRR